MTDQATGITAPTQLSAAESRRLRRTIVGSAVGNIIEQYDFALYGAVAALVFGTLFFPTTDPTAGLIAGFATYAVGFIARPLGSLVAGHLGDIHGRKRVLVAMLLFAGVSTTLIGVLPTYQAIGVWAPIFLVLLRFVQGFSFGGEYGGAILMVAESAPRERRGFYTGFIPASSSVGVLLSTGALFALSFLPPEQFQAWGWRLPFLFSIVLVGVGLFIRVRLEETDAFVASTPATKVKRRPIIEAIRTNPKEILLSAGISFGFGSLNYVVLAFILSYIAITLGLPSTVGLLGLAVAMTFYGISNWASSAASDRVGRRPVIMAGGILFAVWAFPLFLLIDTQNTFFIVIAMSVATILGGMLYGPLASLMSELFATRFRYSGASMGYQLGQTLGGGFSPLIATGLFAATGGSWSVSLYLVAAGLLAAACTWFLSETKAKDLTV